MRAAPDPHHRHRFPATIIAHAVWLYHAFTLSFRDVELLLAERGVLVSYTVGHGGKAGGGGWCRHGRPVRTR